MWYVTKHSQTELDEETSICVGNKGFYGQCWMPLDAIQADALSANFSIISKSCADEQFRSVVAYLD